MPKFCILRKRWICKALYMSKLKQCHKNTQHDTKYNKAIFTLLTMYLDVVSRRPRVNIVNLYIYDAHTMQSSLW